MKTSFYFVLWQFSWLLITLLDIPFLNKYGFFFSCIIVFFADHIIKKFLKKQIEYQKEREACALMEMAYNNEYKQYKRQVFSQMIVYTVTFAYILLIFISLFMSHSSVSLIDYILWGGFMILSGVYSSWHIKTYIKVVKAGRVILDERFQNVYQEYKDERDTSTFEDMLLPSPKYYRAISMANVVFAILSVVIGLITNIILYLYKGEIYSNSDLLQIGLTLYGMLAVYCGIKDLLSISNNQKYLFLLLSIVLVVVLYVPLTNYMNKVSLSAYIADDKNLIYDAEVNLVQETRIVDDINDYESTYIKRRFIVILSSEVNKKMLKKIVRNKAEFHVVYKDTLGEKMIIKITPSELKEIYNQTKSYLDVSLEVLKLDFNGAKVYDDGEFINLEFLVDGNASYLKQSEQTDLSTRLADFTRRCAEDYFIASLNRGMRVRLIFDNQQFIEHALCLGELEKEEKNVGLDELGKESESLFNIFLH